MFLYKLVHQAVYFFLRQILIYNLPHFVFDNKGTFLRQFWVTKLFWIIIKNNLFDFLNMSGVKINILLKIQDLSQSIHQVCSIFDFFTASECVVI